MSRSAEMSTTFQVPASENPGSSRTSVALIGPNHAHRTTMAKALATSDARNVQEFADYPAKLSDLPSIMEQNFDVVMVDVDSDESYALKIVETIAAISTAIVMVYSTRNDSDLVMNCMRAGARDFLPLPVETDEDSAPDPQGVPQLEQPDNAPTLQTAEPRPRPEEATFNIAEFAKEDPAPSQPRPADMRQPDAPMQFQPATVRQPESLSLVQPVEIRPRELQSQPAETHAPEASTTDFNEWDSAWIRKAPAGKAPKTAPRPSAAPDTPVKSKSERSAVPSTPVSIGRTSPKIEKADSEVSLFRHVEAGDTGSPNRNWTKWALIAGAPLAVAGLLMLVFMHPSEPKSAAASGVQVVAPQQSASSLEAVSTTPKPSPNVPATTVLIPDAPARSLQVSSDMMNAQLNAPARISGQMKKPTAVEEEPPTGFTPGALDSGSGVPGAEFGGQSNVKVVPGVSAISAGVAEGMLTRKTPPIYPQFAKDARVSGTVVISAHITPAGTIQDLRAMSGPSILRAPALDAVKTWHYRPYMLDGKPVEVETTIRVIFSLDHN
jgi:protein TonB